VGELQALPLTHAGPQRLLTSSLLHLNALDQPSVRNARPRGPTRASPKLATSAPSSWSLTGAFFVDDVPAFRWIPAIVSNTAGSPPGIFARERGEVGDV